jgi:hydroxyethylthiazole kinase-like sugar kinase family protein
VIGLVIGLSGHGWLILIIASGCLIVATILSNIPNSYLVNIIKNYDPTISAKEATNIAQKHLQESGWDDSSHFVMNIMDGFERVKRLNIK